MIIKFNLSKKEAEGFEFVTHTANDEGGFLHEVSIFPDDSSYCYHSMMKPTELLLKFSLPVYLDFPISSKVTFEAQEYALRTPPQFKKVNSEQYDYVLIFTSALADFGLYKLINTSDGRIKFSMHAKPHEFLQLICDNLTERVSEFSVGDCIDAPETTIEFNHVTIGDALNTIATEFDTEYEVFADKINLKKTEYNKEHPLRLSYGKGNGFLSGIGRAAIANSVPVSRLYVQGGDRNIDRSKYGERNLLLPKNAAVIVGGKTYKTDAKGTYVYNANPPKFARQEDSIDLSNIYPSRVGEVSDVIVANAAKNFYDIKDSSIPVNLNYNDYLIAGNSMTLIFQTGMLAGNDKEFEIKYNHSQRKFELVPQEIDGIVMPNETFCPKIGDKYAIFGCTLPDEYIRVASSKMLEEAAKYLNENEQQKFSFSGTLDGLWAKNDWINVGGSLKVGGYILFTDEQFAPEGVEIRVIGVKQSINDPYSPQVELSNEAPSPSAFSESFRKIKEQEIVIEENRRAGIAYTKRRFRDVQETAAMLEAAIDNFSVDFEEKIKPIALQTMQMVVGDESLQYEFVKASDGKYVEPIFSFDAYSKIFSVKFNGDVSAYLYHYALGYQSTQREITTSKNALLKADVGSGFTSSTLMDTSQSYYLYVKTTKANAVETVGDFRLEPTAKPLEDAEGNLWFLVGTLNSELDGSRSFVSLFGFSEIAPGRMSVDKIVGSNGTSYINLANNSFNLGDGSAYVKYSGGTLYVSNATIEKSLKITNGGHISFDKFDFLSARYGTYLSGYYYGTELHAFGEEKEPSNQVIYNEAGTTKYNCRRLSLQSNGKLFMEATDTTSHAYSGGVLDPPKNTSNTTSITCNGIDSRARNVKILDSSNSEIGQGAIVAQPKGKPNAEALRTIFAAIAGTTNLTTNRTSLYRHKIVGGYFSSLRCDEAPYMPLFSTNYLDARLYGEYFMNVDNGVGFNRFVVVDNYIPGKNTIIWLPRLTDSLTEINPIPNGSLIVVQTTAMGQSIKVGIRSGDTTGLWCDYGRVSDGGTFNLHDNEVFFAVAIAPNWIGHFLNG